MNEQLPDRHIRILVADDDEHILECYRDAFTAPEPTGLMRKLDMLDADATLSHHRAAALALEHIGAPAAARPLARLLDKPGMRGHAMPELEPLFDKQRERRRRTGALREIVLARALLRCGDADGLGARILDEYAHDIRGLFSRHATAVLNAPESRREGA